MCKHSRNRIKQRTCFYYRLLLPILTIYNIRVISLSQLWQYVGIPLMVKAGVWLNFNPPNTSLYQMRLYSPPYLNERFTLALYATTFPSSTFISNFEISAIRRSLRLFAAVSTARLAASSQEESLTLPPPIQQLCRHFQT